MNAPLAKAQRDDGFNIRFQAEWGVAIAASKMLGFSCRTLFIMFCLISDPVWAVCNVSTGAVAFGNYDVFNPTAADSTGNIHVECTVLTSYSIALSTGTGTYLNRQMSQGGNTLNYNLYIDPTRLLVWGDGSGSTLTVPNTAISADHTVYGRIPAQQNVSAGSYTDLIVVTVTF